MIFLSSFMTFPAQNSYCILLNILVLPVKTNNNINYLFYEKTDNLSFSNFIYPSSTTNNYFKQIKWMVPESLFSSVLLQS